MTMPASRGKKAEAVAHAIEHYSQLLGRTVATVKPLSMGHNARLDTLTLLDGSELVAKQGRPSKYGTATLGIEAQMLQFLRNHTLLPIPKVIYESEELLIMSKIASTGGQFTPKAEEDAAEKLAALHGIRGDAFGLEFDTVIGPLQQPNPQTDKWVPFFAEHRLLYMAEQAFHEGLLNAPLAGKIEMLAGKLGDLLEEPEFPALIHGDLWQGNVLTSGNRVTGFIDPAIYYAHPEIELAFTTLFGTFGEPFFKRYNEIRPLSQGFFDTRREIYNLYPQLVHARLYGGGSYLQQVTKTVKRFVG